MKRFLPLVLPFLLLAEVRAEENSALWFFDKIGERYESIRDYQCRIDTYCTDGRSNEHRILNFYFKRPRLIRIDLLWGNKPFDSGSVGVFLGGDMIEGHRGGLLSSLTMTIPKKSPLATTLRGEAFDEIDMEAILSKLYFYIRNGEVRVGRDGNAFWISCVPFDASENGGISRDIAWFDGKTLTITRSQRYEGASLVQEAVWTNYIINAGIPNRLFDPKFDPCDLRKHGITVLEQKY